MDLYARIADAMSANGARVLAMDPTGGQTVAIPTHLDTGGAVVMAHNSPLDPIAPDDHGLAVVAFEAARRRGHGVANVSFTELSGTHRLHIFNLENDHGCFVAIAVPDSDVGRISAHDSLIGTRQGSYRLSSTGVFIDASPEFEQLLGWRNDEVVGRSCLDFVHPDDHENGIHGWIELLERPDTKCRMRQRFLTKDGGWLWCEVTDSNLLSDPADPHVFGELVDVSRELAAQTALQRREALLDQLTRALPSGVFHLDDDGQVEVHNERWTELTGLDPQAGLPALLGAVDNRPSLERALARAEQHHDVDLEVVFAEHASGTCRFGNLHIRPLADGAGMLLTLDDMTSSRMYQDELADLARCDALTGVFNRLGLERAVDNQLNTPDGGHAADHAESVVLFLDLDRFKSINDHHGHAAGDAVLRHVATLLTDIAATDDIVGRLGGDEFLVMVIGEDAADRSVDLADAIEREVNEMARTIPEATGAGVSIGRATTELHDTFDSLLRRADEAMYAVKRRRRYSPPDLQSAA